MINPDNTVNNRIGSTKGTSEKTGDRPEGVVNREKFQEVYGVYERKKTQEELQEEWDRVKQAEGKSGSEKGKKGSSLTKSSKETGESHKPHSLFDLAKETERETESEPLGEIVGEEESVAAPPSKTKQEQEATSTSPRSTSPQPFEKILASPKKAPEPRSSLFDLASKESEKIEPHLEPHLKEQKIVDKKDFEAPAPFLAGQMRQELAQAAPSTPTPAIEKNAVVERGETPAVRLQKIIDEIVEHIYQIEKSGETSTTITLQDKGLFKGVSIKITEFDSAKGQLNITIDNLLPEAKRLIDLHEAALFKALENQGYQLQQFVATTLIENPRFEGEKFSGERQQERQGSQQREKQDKPDDNRKR